MLQADAVPRLFSRLWLAGGLRKLELDFRGRAADPVSANIGGLGRLTQLHSLQLRGVEFGVEGDYLVSVLSPLTQLTRLGLWFDGDHWERGGNVQSDWQHAVCELTKLQELRIGSAAAAADCPYDCDSMYKGALLAILSQLSALRHFSVLGMKEWSAPAVFNQLQLEALPALEMVALQLHTLSDYYPGLSRRRQAVFSRLVSLSLALRVDLYSDNESFVDMHLPAIVAPALTELVLTNIMLAPHNAQLDWLPQLPKLRRLVLTELKTHSSQLPRGIVACCGLTE